MASPLALALVQAAAHPADDTASFLRDVETLAHRHPEVRLLVYPELHLCGPVAETGSDRRTATPEQLSRPLAGERDRRLAEVAGDLGIWLVPGSVYERGADGLVYNTAPVYSADGRRVASYRKICPWRPYETVTPGSDFVVFDMPEHGRVGLSICYDAWFPEISRQLAWLGADLILNLVQTPTVDREQEVVLARANAIVNQVFVASVNGAGPTAVGRSLLVDPEGRIRTSSVAAEEVVLTDVLDLGEAARVRCHGTAGLNRLWDQFQPGDTPLELPIYGGKVDPASWGHGRGASEDDHDSHDEHDDHDGRA
jgi:predicted amidohydrolase